MKTELILVLKEALWPFLTVVVGFLGVLYTQTKFDKRQANSSRDALLLKEKEFEESKKELLREKLGDYCDSICQTQCFAKKVHNKLNLYPSGPFGYATYALEGLDKDIDLVLNSKSATISNLYFQDTLNQASLLKKKIDSFHVSLQQPFCNTLCARLSDIALQCNECLKEANELAKTLE